MKFSLDPPSGYPNSYMDIKFIVEVDTSCEISFTNDSTGEVLNILSASSGYIRDETILVVEPSRIEGHINLFNDDKMNYKLAQYPLVKIRCTATTAKNVENITVSFFNESESIDGGIVPFNLSLINSTLHVDQNEPLQISIVSDKEKKYEIAIKAKNSTNICTIEVLCKPGQNLFEVPCSFLFADLGVAQLKSKEYLCHYVKFQGLDFNGHINRHYIEIPGSSITFTGSYMMPLPQRRMSPDGSELSKDFVLSDRYLVYTWKDFSSFGRRMENVPLICNLPRFYHEAQDLKEREQKITAASVQIRPTPSKPNEKYDIHKNELFRYVNSNATQRLFYEDIAGRVFAKSSPQHTAVAASAVKKSGGCGCSRKK